MAKGKRADREGRRFSIHQGKSTGFWRHTTHAARTLEQRALCRWPCATLHDAQTVLVVVGNLAWLTMSTPESPVDYDDLVATTSIEGITEDETNREILLLLRDNISSLYALSLCSEDNVDAFVDGYGDYHPDSSDELGWLGHFAKKSTHLDTISFCGSDDEIFDRCSRQSVDRFYEDIGKCNRIKKLYFHYRNDLTALICKLRKLGGVMKNNNITHCDVEDCGLGTPQLFFLFSVFQDMKSLEQLSFGYGEEYGDHGLDDDIMAGCIPLLAACTVMRDLNLSCIGLSTRSCAALSTILHRMATLDFLTLYGNSIDDDCVEVLVRGLVECKHIQTLRLERNRISDNGLDVLIRGLPSSVSRLEVGGNQIALARQLPLLRFEKLGFSDNPLSPGAPQVVAASLANPGCRLKSVDLGHTFIGDEGAATLAESLRNNQLLTTMTLARINVTNITEAGWNAFSSVLCDTTSINATHGSNHNLRHLGYADIPQGIVTMLELNSDGDKSIVAAKKILQTHHHLDMGPLFDRELDLLPHVVAWLERFAESRLNLKLSSIFEFVRAMPLDIVDGFSGKKKGKKRRRDNA